MLLNELKKVLGNNANIRILSLLMTGKTITLKQIQKHARVGYYTAKRILDDFKKQNIVDHWIIGKTNAYRIKEESKVIELLSFTDPIHCLILKIISRHGRPLSEERLYTLLTDIYKVLPKSEESRKIIKKYLD